MVNWGPNTVHVIGGNTPAPAGTFGTPTSAAAPGTPGTPTPPTNLFGTSSPAAPAPTGGMFGSTAATTGTPAPLFGTPAPAPGGGLFGSSTPAPASTGGFGSAPAGGSIFGASTTSTGGFGAAPTGGSIFGAPAPSGGLFGSSTPAAAPGFGAPAPAPTGPQIPAAAALRAHQDATARNEEARVVRRLQKLHQAYTTGTVADETSKTHCFSSIVYNAATSQQLQLQAVQNSMVVHNASTPGPIPRPPKPVQFTQDDWDMACIHNPNPQQLVPDALVGAERLQARCIMQQELSRQLHQQIAALEQASQALAARRVAHQQHSIYTDQRAHTLRLRFLKVLQRVEVLRSFQQPLQLDEVKAFRRLHDMGHTVSTFTTPSTVLPTRPEPLEFPDATLSAVVKEARLSLTNMTLGVQEERRDVQLIRDRVLDTKRKQQR